MLLKDKTPRLNVLGMYFNQLLNLSKSKDKKMEPKTSVILIILENAEMIKFKVFTELLAIKSSIILKSISIPWFSDVSSKRY